MPWPGALRSSEGFQALREKEEKQVKVEESLSLNWKESYRRAARTAHPAGSIPRRRLVKAYLCIKEKEEAAVTRGRSPR